MGCLDTCIANPFGLVDIPIYKAKPVEESESDHQKILAEARSKQDVISELIAKKKAKIAKRKMKQKMEQEKENQQLSDKMQKQKDNYNTTQAKRKAAIAKSIKKQKELKKSKKKYQKVKGETIEKIRTRKKISRLHRVLMDISATQKFIMKKIKALKKMNKDYDDTVFKMSDFKWKHATKANKELYKENAQIEQTPSYRILVKKYRHVKNKNKRNFDGDKQPNNQQKPMDQNRLLKVYRNQLQDYNQNSHKKLEFPGKIKSKLPTTQELLATNKRQVNEFGKEKPLPVQPEKPKKEKKYSIIEKQPKKPKESGKNKKKKKQTYKEQSKKEIKEIKKYQKKLKQTLTLRKQELKQNQYLKPIQESSIETNAKITQIVQNVMQTWTYVGEIRNKHEQYIYPPPKDKEDDDDDDDDDLSFFAQKHNKVTFFLY